MTLVKVYTDIGKSKPIVLIAKICRKVRKNIYQIKYLSPTDQKYNGRTIFAYENAVYEVGEDSITEHMNTEDEEVVGFRRNEYGFTKITTGDSEYAPSESEDSEDSDDEDESVVESDADADESVADTDVEDDVSENYV